MRACLTHDASSPAGRKQEAGRFVPTAAGDLAPCIRRGQQPARAVPEGRRDRLRDGVYRSEGDRNVFPADAQPVCFRKGLLRDRLPSDALPRRRLRSRFRHPHHARLRRNHSGRHAGMPGVARPRAPGACALPSTDALPPAGPLRRAEGRQTAPRARSEARSGARETAPDSVARWPPALASACCGGRAAATRASGSPRAPRAARTASPGSDTSRTRRPRIVPSHHTSGSASSRPRRWLGRECPYSACPRPASRNVHRCSASSTRTRRTLCRPQPAAVSSDRYILSLPFRQPIHATRFPAGYSGFSVRRAIWLSVAALFSAGGRAAGGWKGRPRADARAGQNRRSSTTPVDCCMMTVCQRPQSVPVLEQPPGSGRW